MPAKTDIMQLVAPAWVMNERLIYHSQTGRMLDGLEYDVEGKLSVDGYDDYPLLQPWSLSTTENISPGAHDPNATQGSTPIAPTVTVTFRLNCARRDFFFRRDPTLGGKKGMLEWLALIQDAIERKADGSDQADARLDNTLEEPVSFRLLDSETVSQSSFQSFLEVSLPTRHYCRSQRAHEFPAALG